MHRTIVGIRNGNVITVPKFSDCLLGYFTKDNSATVNYSLENGILILNECKVGHELRHSPECPIKLNYGVKDLEQTEINEEVKNANMRVATSVVVESSDSHILLTKRPTHMRSSPNVWVVPGGHLEPGESVIEAGVREIEEETGLQIQNQNASVLGLWENVYPLLLGIGPPKSHVLVIYLHTKLNEDHVELTKKIRPNPEEVLSYCWLNFSQLDSIFNPDNNHTCDGKEYICKNGEIKESYLDCSSMFNRWLRLQPEPYSGVSFALRMWMKKVISGNLHPKF